MNTIVFIISMLVWGLVVGRSHASRCPAATR